MSWDEGLPLGNGLLGALVWGNGAPLNISLDRTDLWDLRPVPEFHSPEYTYQTMCQWKREGHWERLEELYRQTYCRSAGPTKIPAGRIEIVLNANFGDARLDLEGAMASLKFGRGTQIRVFVHALQPVGIISIDSMDSISTRLIAPPFGGQNAPKCSEYEIPLTKLGYPSAVETSGDGWRAFTQHGFQGFHFAVYLGWRVEGKQWQAAWSVASSSEGKDPLAVARQRVEKVLQSGFDKMAVPHRRWWKDYWQKSSVCLPNKIIERQWFLEQYKFGAASRRGAPPVHLQGPWIADDGKVPPWKGDYHHDLNTELSYWPCYSANHLEEGLSFLDWLWETRSYCFDWTKRFFGKPGLNVPGVADLNNNPIGGGCLWSHSATTGAWLAHHFYLHWRYSADRRFLRDRAYPYLKDAATFVAAITEEKDSDGKRTLPLSASPEIHENRMEACFPTITNYDLALIRWLFGAAAELAGCLCLSEEAEHWRSVLSEMPDFACGDDGRLLVAKGHPLPFSHRHFSHLMAIHPLGLFRWDDGLQAQRTILAALAELDRTGTGEWCGYSFAWLVNLSARARNGEKAARAAEIFATAFCLRNSFHCNGDQSGKGYSTFTYRPFTLEGNFACAAGIQEMLLQSHGGAITVFPAIPDEWKDLAFDTLRAEGAFLVSAIREGGSTRSVTFVSEKGGVARLANPFGGTPATINAHGVRDQRREGDQYVFVCEPGARIEMEGRDTRSRHHDP